jgi:hypothetical protein
VNSTKLAQKLYRASRIENGYPRDAWALARRLAGYLRSPDVKSNEELAFSRDAEGRIGVTRFRCNIRGKTQDFVMISFEPAGLADSIWNRLIKLAATRSVLTGSVWK